MARLLLQLLFSVLSFALPAGLNAQTWIWDVPRCQIEFQPASFNDVALIRTADRSTALTSLPQSAPSLIDIKGCDDNLIPALYFQDVSADYLSGTLPTDLQPNLVINYVFSVPAMPKSPQTLLSISGMKSGMQPDRQRDPSCAVSAAVNPDGSLVWRFEKNYIHDRKTRTGGNDSEDQVEFDQSIKCGGFVRPGEINVVTAYLLQGRLLAFINGENVANQAFNFDGTRLFDVGLKDIGVGIFRYTMNENGRIKTRLESPFNGAITYFSLEQTPSQLSESKIRSIHGELYGRFACPTNVHEIETSSFEVYPNPANDMVTVSFDEMGDYELILHDVFGKEIIRQTSTDRQPELNLSDYASGLYFLTLKGKTKSAVVKVIKY
jgi:hypothetical protein